MNALDRALISKAGHDNGFEHVLADGPDGLVLASARHGARAEVAMPASGGYSVALQAPNPALLPELARAFAAATAGGDFVISTEAELARLLRRAAGLARALPSQAAQDYETAVAKEMAQLPPQLAGTEVERVVRQRVGQSKFRDAMLDYWGGACAVTGVALPDVLRASHAKPWAECVSDAERLDVFNGFLLSANLDALFDRFLISFDETGALLLSRGVSQHVLEQLGLSDDLRLRWLAPEHQTYLEHHRLRFQDNPDLP